MNQILAKITHQFTKELPFVCFRKPNLSLLKGYFCSSRTTNFTEDFQESGFVFAPFDFREKSLIFLDKKSEILVENLVHLEDVESKFDHQPHSLKKDQYIALVEKAMKAIESGRFKKVVLSRKEVLEVGHLEIAAVFSRLLYRYRHAFVYVWYHPKVGLWMGATPERLIALKQHQFKTMALAGTQVFKDDERPIWGVKEIEEHQYVVDYIVSQIQNTSNQISLKEFSVSKTYTSKAGGLLHLRADITGTLYHANLRQLIRTLHPTPAICGLPKKRSFDFIMDHEGYDRSFYTGFLGELNVEETTELFVNLRCMRFKDSQVHIYVGGGITPQSNPLAEWEETEAKTQTIKSIL